jgi:hypothetical protein
MSAPKTKMGIQRLCSGQVSDHQRSTGRGSDTGPVIGTPLARAKMAADFKRWGSQDLQRGTQWGIPEGSVVPAFASGASHYLGFVSGLNGIPLEYAEIGGKATNPFNKDPSGPYGISQQNYQNLVRGQSDATAMRAPVG